MASFNRKTNRVTLSGEEMFELALFILNNIKGKGLEDVYSEISLSHRVANEKEYVAGEDSCARFTIHKQNQRNFGELRVEFDIDTIFPDDG